MMKSFIFYKYILILGFIASTFTAFAQCTTSLNTIPSTLDTINCGESIGLQITMPNSDLSDDFSSGSLGSIWNSTTLNYVIVSGSNGCNTPVYCPTATGLPAGVTAISAPSDFFWFNGGPAGWLTTDPLDIGCTGTISLDYRHETQSPAPCDGPDQPNEGQYLEYRTNAPGAVWTQINYWVPVNSGGPIYQHCWNRYTFNITNAMISTGTEFRIGTLSTSGGGWDQWAIGNVSIDLDQPCGSPYTSILIGPNIPVNYPLDTITVTPLTDSVTYYVIASNAANSCTDSVTVYVEQPTIVASVIPALCVGSDTLDAVATITNRCNYTLVLRNYASPAPNQPGWGTGQPAPGDYNYVYLYRNGNPSGFFTMGSGGQNATDTFPLPMRDGDLLETEFTGLGVGSASGNDCYYYIYDSQMAQVAATLYGPTPNHFWNMISANIINAGTGYNAPPYNAGNPQPTCTVSGGGGIGATCTVNGVQFGTGIITAVTINQAPSYQGYNSPPTITITGTNTTPATVTASLGANVNNNGPGIIVNCPVTTTYTYAWTNLTSGGTTGLSNPNIPNPISTVSIPTQYQVVATNNLNTQCVAIDTISVPGTPSNGSFDITLTSPSPICNDGTPINITFEISSNAPNAITSGSFTFDVEDGNGNIIFPNLPLNASLLPHTGVIPASALPSPLVAGSYDFTITNFQDLTPCPVAVNNATITIVVNDPPVIGTPPLSTIDLCTSTPITDTLFTSWISAPDINGTWTYVGGVSPPGSNLPFNGFNYSLDPSLFPVGNHYFNYQIAGVAGCFPDPPFPSQVSINITGAPYAGVLPANGPDLCVNGSSIPFDLNSLFTSTPAPFSPLYWTDITGGVPGPATSSNFTPSSPGIYTLRYTAPITGNCPADIEDIIIEVFDQPTAIISTDDPNNTICDGDPINLQFNLTGSANYIVDYIDANSGPQTVTLNAAGNDLTNSPIQIFPTIGPNLYTITNITDGNSCSNTAQPNVVVTVVMQPNAGNTTITTICSDDFFIYSLNGIPFFTGGDANGSWTYQGTIPPTSYPFPAPFQATIDPFGTYRYTVSDPTGTCPTDWEDITIVAEMAPNTGNATDQDICVNEYGGVNPLYNLDNLLDGTQDVGGDWFYAGTLIPTGTIDPNIYSLGVNAFTYEIVPAAPSVCTNNGSLPYITQSILTIHPEPVVDPLTFVNNPPNPTSVPQSTSTTITVDMLIGTPPFTVSLSGNESTPPGQSSGTFNILSGMSGSGSFTPNYDITTNPVSISIVSVMDGNGCWAYPTISTPVTVEPWPLIAASVSNSIPCETDVVNLLLEGIQGAVPLNVFYTINGTAQPTALVGNLLLPALSIPVSGSPNWSITTNTIQVTSIVDAMGNICPINLLPSTINVLVNPNPIISSFTTPDSLICEGDDAILEFNFSVGTPPFNVSINGSGIPPLIAMTAQYTISPALIAAIPPYNYSITNYQDLNGCLGSIIPNAIDITVDPLPEIGINPFSSEICEGDSIALNLIPVNTSIPIAGDYTIIIIDSNGDTIQRNIDQNGNVSGQGGTSFPIVVYPMVTTTYTIINFYDPLTSCGSVSPNNTATLIVNEKPAVSILSTPPEVCAGDPSYITFIFTRGASPWTINYNNNSFPVSLGPWNDTTTVTQILTSTTNYDFTRVTDDKGCYTDLFDNFDIVVNPLPIAELAVDNRFICDNENSNATLTFEVSSGALPYKIFYRVNLDDTQIPDSIGNVHTIDTNVTGDYSIIRVVDSKGCEAIEKGEMVTIVVNPTPTAEFMVYPQPTDINSPFISFVNQSSGHITSIWTGYNLLDSNNNVTSFWSDTLNTNSTFIHEFEAVADTHYILLEVISDSGCIARDSSFIIIDPSFTIFVPDAFTPDNDLHNDYFLPIVNGIQEYTLSIYDRLGNRIFETNDYISQDCARGCTKKKIEEAIYKCIEGCDAAWDGKINNEFVPAGTFVYSIVLIDLDGKTRNFNGSLTLIR